jgi:putative peptidoglycan lipid II flippase
VSGGSEPTSSSRDTGRSALAVGAGIVSSRASGLVREFVLAGLLGTRAVADAFRFALQIPGLLQNVLGEGVLSASFVPVYAQKIDERDDEAPAPEEAARLAGTVLALLGLLTALVVLVGILAARPITRLLLFRLPDDTFELTVPLVRIMWAGLGFIVLAAWCLGVLNAHRRFFLSYFAPVLWNAAQVALATYAWLAGWSDSDIAKAAAWGVVVGGALQFLVQVPAVLRVAPSIRPALDLGLSSVREVTRRFVPAVGGRGVVQLSAFVDLVLAGLLAAGAVTGMTLAQILYLLPIGVFAMSIVAADLPELARDHHSHGLVSQRLSVAQERVGFYIAFSAVAFVFSGKAIVGATFQRGEFTADDTVFVWLVLAGYSLGLVASGSSRVLQNACFALGDVSGPARLAALRVTIAGVLGAALMIQAERYGVVGGSIEQLGDLPAFDLLPEAIREDDTAPQRLGAVGLALGSAVGAWLENALLRRRLRAHLDDSPLPDGPTRALLPAAGAAAAIAGGLAFTLDGLHPLARAPIVLASAGSVYVLIAAARGCRPAIDLLDIARRRGRPVS